MSILDGMLSKGADKERADFAKFWEFFLHYGSNVVLPGPCDP